MLTMSELEELINEHLKKVMWDLKSTPISHLHYCDAGWYKRIYCTDLHSPFAEGEYEEKEGVIVLKDARVQYIFVHHRNLPCLGVCQLIYRLAEEGQIALI